MFQNERSTHRCKEGYASKTMGRVYPAGAGGLRHTGGGGLVV